MHLASIPFQGAERIARVKPLEQADIPQGASDLYSVEGQCYLYFCETVSYFLNNFTSPNQKQETLPIFV